MYEDSDTAPANSADAKIDQLLELTTLDDPDFNQTLSGGDYGDWSGAGHELVNFEATDDQVEVDLTSYHLATQSAPIVIGMMVLTFPLPDPANAGLGPANSGSQGIDLLSCRS
jgi:hypothetical protein